MNSFLGKWVLKLNWSYYCTSNFRKLSTVGHVVDGPPYKILFFGTDDFAKTCLEYMAFDMQKISGRCVHSIEVVCLPNQKELCAVGRFAKRQSFLVHKWKPTLFPGLFDIGVVVSFGKLIPKSIIKAFPYGMINVHGSLLPNLRGAAPVERAIESGYKTTGVTVIEVAPWKFDHGKILAQSHAVQIGDQCFGEELRENLAVIGAELCLKVLHNLPARLQCAKEQGSLISSLAPKVTLKDTLLDFRKMTAEDVWNKYRAFGYKEQFHLRCAYDDQPIKLTELSLPSIKNWRSQVRCEEIQPGQAFYHKRLDKVLIICKDELIACSSFKFCNKKLSAKDFYNGHMQVKVKRGEMPLFRSMVVCRE